MHRKTHTTPPKIILLAAIAVSVSSAAVLEPPMESVPDRALFSVFQDFNDDGHPDLVGALRFIDRVVFLPGDGAGGFGPAWEAPVGNFPYAVAAGDFDEDGELDLVVTNFTDLSILLGNGDGTFAPEYRVQHGGELAKFPVAEDLDDDGHLDLVVALRGVPYLVAILLGHGDGTFDPVVHLPAVTRPRVPVVEDLDGDGALDLAVVAETSGDLAVYLGNGDGTFQAGMFSDFPGNGATDMVGADLDGDGVIDLALGDTFGEAVHILLGNGDGTFEVTDNIVLGENVSVPGLGLGDFNGDGHDDLLAVVVPVGTNDNRVFLLAGSGNGNFLVEESVPIDAEPEHVLVGDVNGDDFDDAILSLGGIIVNSSAPEPGACLDGDGDGFGVPGDPGCPGGAATDCDDADPARSPGLGELCDGLDNDCDGSVDEIALCNDRPKAAASAAEEVECQAAGTATVTLDGSGSSDPDSTPGTNDDIVAFEWFEDLGLPTESSLGTGEIRNVVLGLGTHSLSLVVTDTFGLQDIDTFPVTVQDTKGPALTVLPDPDRLWPPNHGMVDVGVTLAAMDLCDPSPVAMLISATSSEPDNAPGTGDGDTEEDIAGADPGTADTALQLRAERAADGPGRTYELRYETVDASGNLTPAVGIVTVPHDLGAGPEPLLLRLEPGASMVDFRILWTTVPEATGYDVIAGDLSAAAMAGWTLGLGSVEVLARGTTATSLLEPAEPGTTGGVRFYLAQYRTDHGGTGYGTESAPWPREPTSCAGGCP